MSDLEFRPNQKLLRVSISSTKYAKNTNTDTIALHIYNNSPYKTTLPLGLLGYWETKETLYRTQEKPFRVNSILKSLHNFKSTILNEELSINKITNDSKRNMD